MKEGTLMPSDKPDKVEHWRHPVSAVQTLSATAFAEKVMENGLRVVGPYAGYLYAAVDNEDGFDMIRTYSDRIAWLYQARRVLTQDNAGGGALRIKVSIASGQVAKLVAADCTGPASNTTLVAVLADEDGAITARLASIGAGVSNEFSLPSIGGAATTTANVAHSLGLVFGAGQTIWIDAAAAAQTETLTLGISLLLPSNTNSTGSDVTWSVVGSAGTPNLGASTISTTNTMTLVVLP